MNMIKNSLAVFGLLCLLAMFYLGNQVITVMNRIDTFDEYSVDIYSKFLQTTYEKGSVMEAMVYRVEVQPGISVDEVDASIHTIADELNIRNVGELALSKQVEAISGKPYRFVKIYLLCNAMTAASMLNYNEAFASILPCRLSLVEDEQGRLWIYTLDLDLMIHGGQPMPPALKTEALKVRDTLYTIMQRAAEGDF